MSALRSLRSRWHRAALLIGITAVLSLVGCSSSEPTAAPSAMPSPSTTTSASPAIEATAEPSVGPSAAPTPIPTPAGPVSLIGAKILATYPLPTRANWSLLASPGQLWVATVEVGGGAAIDVRSPADASLIANVPLARGKSQAVRGMAFDGQRVWVITADLASGDVFSGMTVQLVAIDSVSHKIVFNVKLPKMSPLTLDYAAGKILMGAQCHWYAIDPTTGKVITSYHDANCPGYPSFAAGGGFVWVADETRGTQVWDATTLLFRRSLDQSTTKFTFGGGRMWAIGSHFTSPSDTTPTEFLAFSLSNPTAQPAPAIRLETEYGLKSVVQPDYLIYDGASFWLGSGLDRFVSQHDGQTGHVLQRIAIESAADFALATNLPKGIAFDGHDLWVLTAQSLIRIGAP